MSQIFISYRREDSAGYAGRLRESLERRLGKGAVFRDVDALEPGQDFVDIIGIRLRDASACLVLIGREWLDAEDASGRRRLVQQNDYVRLEIATALEQPKMRVIPVLVEGTRMPATEELPETIQGLARRQAVSLRDESWDEDVKRFVTALDRRSWVQRYRLALAASAAVVVLGALAVTQFVGPQVSPGAEITTSVPSIEPAPPPAAPPTSAPVAVAEPADTPLTRGSPQEPPAAAPSSTVARGTPARPPATTTTGRTARPVGPDSGRTSRASVQPTINPTVAPTAPASVAGTPGAAPPARVPSGEGDVVTRPPAAAPPASPVATNTPAVVIPPSRPTITPAVLVRQTIAEYERAAEARDLEGVRRVWPGAPDALRNSYRNLRSQSVDLDCADASISGDTATISCREEIRSVGAGGITLPVATSTAMFSLRRNGDAWEISRITRQRR